MIRYLVWDLDGTLLDTYPAIVQALRSALRDLGIEAEEPTLDPLCKVSYSYCLSTLSQEHGLPVDALRSRLEAYQRAEPMASQPPFPGVEALCATMCSIGGSNFVLTHRDRDSLHDLLEMNGMTRWITDSVAGDDGFPRKPDPAGLVALLARNNVPSQEALLIGDRDLDVAAANAAGIRSCFYGTNPRTEPATFVVTDYGWLLAAIKEENRACNRQARPAGGAPCLQPPSFLSSRP